MAAKTRAYSRDDISRDNSSSAGPEMREIFESSKRDFSAFAIASRASEMRAEMPLPSRDRASPSMRSAAYESEDIEFSMAETDSRTLSASRRPAESGAAKANCPLKKMKK